MLTAQKIPAVGSQNGANYRYLDSEADAAETYQYWLMEVDISGELTVDGPVSRFGGYQLPERQAIYMPIIESAAVADVVAGQVEGGSPLTSSGKPLVGLWLICNNLKQ